jgi:hypothetical protein
VETPEQIMKAILTTVFAIALLSLPAHGQGFIPQNQMNRNEMQSMLDLVSDSPGKWQTSPPPQNMMPPQQQQMMQQRGAFPRPSRRDVMRVFFEGGSLMQGGASPMPGGGGAFGGGVGFRGGGAGGGPAPNSNAGSTAYSNYQRAMSEERSARNYANKARCDKDKWIRKDSATRAEYAANNANYAAQRAESAAYNGDAQARGYASQARACANRARSNANQARYNADSIR